ncbi:Fc.00g066310.m01.CDS01 [Cosmosporella sp. VM-42]
MASNYVVHDAASKGFSKAQAYDAHRPSYPSAVLSSFLSHLDLQGKSHSRIVDLAAGTGKFTEVLARREEEYEILAVEPVEPMRNTLEKKGLKGVVVRSGTADNIDAVEAGWADGVIAAQAFHWFAKEAALKDIHRVLKPGAKLGLIWNIEDYNRPLIWPASTQWEGELSKLNFSLPADDQPRFRHDVWHEVFTRQAKAEKPLFSTPIETERVQWSVWLTLDALWDRVNTLSWISLVEGEDRRVYREKFEKIVKDGAGTWNEKGEIEVHGCTFYAWTRRL